jgi:hypothetical protein
LASSERKADRWLIIGGIIVLLCALGFLTFDDWLWGGARRSGDVIGTISGRSGDVRLKFDGDVKWQKAAKGENLIYNDTIFAGAKSEADLQLGASSLKISENTLVVLRRQDNARFLNLNYGKLLGKIAKDDKILIDTGDGRHAVLSATDGAEVSLEKKNGKTEVKVTKGEAQLESQDGTKQKITPNAPPVVAERAPAPPPPPPVAVKPPPPPVAANYSIRALKPKATDVFYSKEPLTQSFEWTYDGKPAVEAKDRFVIEFAKTQGFETLLAAQTVDGKLKEDVHARNYFDVYYRIRGPKNELSQTEKFKFIRMEPPQIIKPLKDAVYSAPPQHPAAVKVEFGQVRGNPRYWMQVAADEDFKTVLVNESKSELTNVQALPSGVYYLRARTDFGSEHLSDWSPAVPFQVREHAAKVVKPLAVKPPPVTAPPPVAFENSVTISNKQYPKELYSASRQQVQHYLASNEGMMQDYFGALKGQSDEVVLDTMDGAKPSATGYRWPASKIYPGQRSYRYQVLKKGQKPSRWSANEKVNIVLEPPQQTSLKPILTKPMKDGRVPMSLKFTPLLFANQYQVQMAGKSDFSDAKSINVKKAELGFYAKENAAYYWRARALDEKGQPISAYSTPESLDTAPIITQAKNQVDKKRQPASEESTIAMTTPGNHRSFEMMHGYWMWVGSGINFTSYTQSIFNVGTFDSHDVQPLGAYLEFGFGDGKWGGVFSYKNAPGNITTTNTTVNNPSFQWQTLTAEALYCPIAPKTLLGDPVNFGLRAGVQYHQMPFATVNAAGTALNVTTLNMLNASIGGLAEWARRNWRYYWTMRYQYPLSATGASTEITPTFAFDGSLGSAYYFAENWKMGLFWYGQWQQFQFQTSAGGRNASGSQMLFYSAMDLRLGYDF